MKALKFIWIFVISIALFSCNSNGTKDENGNVIITEISPEQLKKAQGEKAEIIDVRTPEEYKEGHVAGAKNINVFDANFVKKMEASYKKDQPIYLYCKAGSRSMKASKMLKEAGYTKIYNVDGGFLAWKSKNYQIEK
ncbi:rhodanese-like domain-containing protein [Aureivirga sp. CE67]|uniref:rhodanese-like domain-containing protein n=1 Tax=Aureivirga sp. CE67 TaxID=1788983 RepID=UPI0018C927E5|nr:rhodanese-like domain-containing protein [Aureivirga sp. CE67]